MGALGGALGDAYCVIIWVHFCALGDAYCVIIFVQGVGSEGACTGITHFLLTTLKNKGGI